MLGIFAIVALALAAIGIYGVSAFSIAQRVQEIGIRMALSAEQSNVLAMIVRESLTLVLVSISIGALGALALTRSVAAMLYGISPTDPLTFIAVAVVLLSVALLASYLPAKRASGIDPAIALRNS